MRRIRCADSGPGAARRPTGLAARPEHVYHPVPVGAATSFFDYPGDDDPSVPAADGAFLARFDDDDVATLLEHSEVRRVRAGQTLIHLGDTDTSIFVVTDGTLEARLPRKRRPVRLSTLSTGSVVGELSFFDGQPRSAEVVAVTDAEVVRLSPAGFDTLCAAHPALGRRILLDLARVLAGRLRASNESVRRLSR